MIFRRPLHEVARWPAAEVELLLAYMRRQPPAEERVEILLAQIATAYHNVHRTESAPLTTLAQFLPYRDPWHVADLDDPRYSELDREILKAI